MKENKAPAAFFILGHLLELAGKEYQSLLSDNKLFNIESHTYSHARMLPPNNVGLEELREEIGQTRKLIKDWFGTNSIGLRAPGNFFKGLQGHPDVLEIVWRGNTISRIRWNGAS